MSSAVQRLLRLLDLERVDDTHFVGSTPSDGPGRLFGGQVASQSLRAATLTVDPSRPPNSMHAYFIRPGSPGTPLELEVELARDGRSFSTRRVTASQDGAPILELLASFHVAEEGDDWQLEAPVDTPPPEELGEIESPLRQFESMLPFELVPVRRDVAFPVLHPFWVRVREPLPDDLAMHACALAFISDMGVVGSARAPNSTAGFGGASLDHAVWFHRPVRADDWLLFSVDPLTNHGARGLAKGTMHTRDGTLVASIAQEALLRPTATVPLP